MSQKPMNIQLVSDGDGNVVLIVDGKPEGTYFIECGDYLPLVLEKKIANYLARYGEQDLAPTDI